MIGEGLRAARTAGATQKRLQLRAWLCGTAAYTVTASVLLHSGSSTILQQVSLALILTILFAPPMFVALRLASSITNLAGRGLVLVFAAIAELFGFLMISFPGGPLDALLGHRVWQDFFSEFGALERMPSVLGSESALLVVALSLWPWVPREHSVRGPRI